MNVITAPTSRTRRDRRRGDRRTEDFQVSDRRASASAQRRGHVDPPQDSATYSCACGYVFAASVSTSVACPHCGGAQAW